MSFYTSVLVFYWRLNMCLDLFNTVQACVPALCCHAVLPYRYLYIIYTYTCMCYDGAVLYCMLTWCLYPCGHVCVCVLRTCVCLLWSSVRCMHCLQLPCRSKVHFLQGTRSLLRGKARTKGTATATSRTTTNRTGTATKRWTTRRRTP